MGTSGAPSFNYGAVLLVLGIVLFVVLCGLSAGIAYVVRRLSNMRTNKQRGDN